MRDRLGIKVGEGAFADVHAWEPGRVIKLYRHGVSRRLAMHEARMTDAALSAGLPAPTVFGEAIVDGRIGLVLSRFDGPTLMALSRQGAVSPQDAGAILAELAFAVHETASPDTVPTLAAFLKGSLPGSDIPDHVAAAILAHVERLPAGNGLCHADLHPGNVIMAADGPKLIDWTGLVRAPAAFDLAVSHLLLSEIVAARVDDPQRPRAVDAAMQREYAWLTGTSMPELAASLSPYLPVARVSTLFADLPLAERQRLIESVEAALR